MQIRKKMFIFFLVMVMVVSVSISGYAASSVNLVVTEKSNSKVEDRKYNITYSGTYVGSIDACSYKHTALLLFTTTGIIQYYTERTEMTIRYYNTDTPGKLETKNFSDTGTANGNRSECYKSLNNDEYMRSLDGYVALDGFWSYSVQAQDNETH